MRFITLTVTALLGGLSLLCHSALAQTDCVIRKDEQGITVYACEVTDSKIKSLKTVLEVEATVQEVIDIILDVNEYNNWQYHTINAHVVKSTSEHELIYYTEIVSPWPASNRDLVVQLRIEKDESGRVDVFTQSVPEFLPKKEGVVRVPMSKSQWILKPIDETTLSVEFRMQVDPGGSVPAWLINMVAAQAPYESFLNFKKKLEKKK